ncbi:MAG: dihydrodipicolinate synthetase [Opitutus sp.]|nr:dihydrodipicolinate synthetase [Opitutus sp.]
MNSRLHGLIAAPHTPFGPDGEVALEVIPKIASLLVRNGVKGAFICGTTGEGQSLTISERQRIASAWRKAAPPELKLIVHVGHLSLGESVALARHAQEIGADAIATLAPSFFRPPGVAELIAWCQPIAAAAPKLPFYYYHMPAMTGVNISATDFLTHGDGKIPTLAGVKFTHEDLMDYGRALEVAGGRFTMLFGRDEIILAGLALGSAGAVGSTYNFAAPLYLRLIKAFESGDLAAARADQKKARDFITILHRHGGLGAGKAVMKMLGVDCGPVRLPLRAMTAAQEAQLKADLEGIKFFDYACRP